MWINILLLCITFKLKHTSASMRAISAWSFSRSSTSSSPPAAAAAAAASSSLMVIVDFVDDFDGR